MKIRHFGFLANRGRRHKIRLCRKLLDIGANDQTGRLQCTGPSVIKQQEPKQVDPCPVCKVGSLRAVEILLPRASTIARPAPRSVVAVLETDTS